MNRPTYTVGTCLSLRSLVSSHQSSNRPGGGLWLVTRVCVSSLLHVCEQVSEDSIVYCWGCHTPCFSLSGCFAASLQTGGAERESRLGPANHGCWRQAVRLQSYSTTVALEQLCHSNSSRVWLQLMWSSKLVIRSCSPHLSDSTQANNPEWWEVIHIHCCCLHYANASDSQHEVEDKRKKRKQSRRKLKSWT